MTADSAPSDSPGLSERTAAAHAADDRHPRALFAIAFVELCVRFTEPAWQLMWLLSPSQSGQSGGDDGRVVPTGDTGFAVSLAMAVLFTVAMLSGGVLGDRVIGHRRTLAIGISTIVVGALVSMIRIEAAAYAALALLFMGIGLTKANNLFILVTRYGRDNPRRVAGFAIFEAAGAAGYFLGLLMCNALVDARLWHVAAGAFTIVAALALLVVRTYPKAGEERWSRHAEPGERRQQWRALAALGTAPLLVSLLIGVSAWYVRSLFEQWSLLAVFAAIVVGFGYWAARQRWTVVERRHLRGIAVLFACAASISALGAILNHANHRLRGGSENFLASALPSYIPSGPMLTLVAALLFALLWTGLARRRIQPRPGPVLAISALLLAYGFLNHIVAPRVIPGGAEPDVVVPATARVIALNLIGPVLLATVTRLSPLVIGATILGIWPLATHLGNLTGNKFDNPSPGIWPWLGVLACVLAALVFARKDARITELETGHPVPAQRLRWRMRVAYASLFLLALATVQLGSVNGAPSAAARAAPGLIATPASTATVFHGADLAYLPNEPNLGFITIESLAQPVGALEDDSLASLDERPVRMITTSRFLIGRYEVTVAQYGVCVDEGWCRPSDPRARTGAPQMPVRYVSWHEAREYCAWLQQKKILDTRITLIDEPARITVVTLATEAEWERAARSLVYSSQFSRPLDPTQVNFARSGRLGPIPVSQLKTAATASGLQQMAGNVAEWTNSEYRAYPYDPLDGREDTSNITASRVIRGGSFYDDMSLLRPSSRQAADPTRGYDFVGFRVAIRLAVRRASVGPPSSTSPTSSSAPPPSPLR
jgi:formylglycine-generating enzyme required for sulfatase activity/dipeptide/tripeptide permease